LYQRQLYKRIQGRRWYAPSTYRFMVFVARMGKFQCRCAAHLFSLMTSRKSDGFVTRSCEKIQKIFVFGFGKRWFLHNNTRNAAAVLLFQKQRSERGSSVTFRNAALQTPQQCCFFKTNVRNAAAVFIFENERWKCRSSVGFGKAALET